MVKRRQSEEGYPALMTDLPPHLHARLVAASAVLRVPIENLVESALEAHLEGLEPGQQELIDRLASETVRRTKRQ